MLRFLLKQRNHFLGEKHVVRKGTKKSYKRNLGTPSKLALIASITDLKPSFTARLALNTTKCRSLLWALSSLKYLPNISNKDREKEKQSATSTIARASDNQDAVLEEDQEHIGDLSLYFILNSIWSRHVDKRAEYVDTKQPSLHRRSLGIRSVIRVIRARQEYQRVRLGRLAP